MKNVTKPSASKLVKQIDATLKNILLDDLNAFRLKNQFVKNAVVNNATAA